MIGIKVILAIFTTALFALGGRLGVILEDEYTSEGSRFTALAIAVGFFFGGVFLVWFSSVLWKITVATILASVSFGFITTTSEKFSDILRPLWTALFGEEEDTTKVLKRKRNEFEEFYDTVRSVKEDMENIEELSEAF